MANTKKSEQKLNNLDNSGKKNKNYVFAAFGLATSLGINLAVCILVGVASGKFADGFFGTYPYLTLTGIIVGVLSGVWVIYKKIINFER